MSNMHDFAAAELARLRKPGDDPDPMQDAMEKHILHIVDEFAAEGHSGSSAGYALGILKKVLAFEPITPLTGDDDEWMEYADGMFQNRRCPHVFKNGRDGDPYDNEGRIFRYPDGSCVTRRDSRVPIQFPYTPTREYVDIDDAGEPVRNPKAGS